MTRDNQPRPGETYLEIVEVGGSLRVAAADATTGEEVVFQAPKTASRAELERLALAKLKWKLDKLAAEKKRPGDEPGRGIKV